MLTRPIRFSPAKKFTASALNPTFEERFRSARLMVQKFKRAAPEYKGL
jgi:hypothetical protein